MYLKGVFFWYDGATTRAMAVASVPDGHPSLHGRLDDVFRQTSATGELEKTPKACDETARIVDYILAES